MTATVDSCGQAFSVGAVLTVYYDPIYTDGLDPSVRFPRERYRLLAVRLQQHPQLCMQRPRRATREEILRAHKAD